jgi:hypothetical protein
VRPGFLLVEMERRIIGGSVEEFVMNLQIFELADQDSASKQSKTYSPGGHLLAFLSIHKELTLE